MDRRTFVGSACTWIASPLCAAPAQNGITKTEIVFGQSSDFSSSRAAVSKGYAEGTSLVFDAVNAAGGIHGRKIRIFQSDDAYSVPKAMSNARELIEEHEVFALLHCLGTAIVEKLVPYAEEMGVPNIHPLTGADHVRPPEMSSRQTFFLRASYGREIDRIAMQLKTIGITKVALVHEAEPFGESIRHLAVRALGAHRIRLAAIGVFPFNKPDEVAAALAAVSKAEPTAIIVGSAGPSVENFIRGYHELGKRAQYYCLSVSNVERIHKALGKLSEGIVVAQVMPSVATSRFPVVAAYRDAVGKAGGSATSFGLEGYISARMIADALRASGPAPTRDRFVAALAATSQVGGFPVAYNEEPRHGSPFVELAMIGSGGKLLQ